MRHVGAILQSVRTITSRAMSRGVTLARLGVSTFIGITTLILMPSMGWGQNTPPGPTPLPSLPEVSGQHGAVDVTLPCRHRGGWTRPI